MYDGYKVADLSNNQDLSKINEYEQDLKQKTGQDIVLIAYTKDSKK